MSHKLKVGCPTNFSLSSLRTSVTTATNDKLKEPLIKWMRQLFGVRWPGSALVVRDLSRRRLLELIP
ncbi:MAG TPA: hypothetical protein VN951_15560 [Pyrinomonadaceae bacterium]|nr:hypothetical protein [Pyrinomonadaceae bacterium]